MTAEEYFRETRKFSNVNIEPSWFIAEVTYYSAIGRVLDSLRNHLRLGCGIERDKILKELGFLLKSFVDLCVCKMSHYEFIQHNWNISREMVPAGVNGCANSILNMIRSPEISRSLHWFANACSQLGFTFDDVSFQSLSSLREEGLKQE